MLEASRLILFVAIAIGLERASSAGICDDHIYRYRYTRVDKSTKGRRDIVWGKLVFLPKTSLARCGEKCLFLGSTCGAFAIKKNTDCLLLGNITDMNGQPWVNSDGSWDIYAWEHVTVKIPVFRVSSGLGVSVRDTWLSELSSSLSEASLSGYLNLSSPLNTFYKHPIVNDWQNWNITEVHMSLYRDMTEVLSLSFDGLFTTALTWFAKSQLRSSPWTDLDESPTNFFSIFDWPRTRNFFITFDYVRCYNETGWLVALDGYDCGWTTRPAYPSFSYVSGKSRQNWFSDDVMEADDLVISVILSL